MYTHMQDCQCLMMHPSIPATVLCESLMRKAKGQEKRGHVSVGRRGEDGEGVESCEHQTASSQH